MSDSISPKGSLLLSGQTVVDLTKLGRMPQIRHLTEAIRSDYSRLDPLFLEKVGSNYLAEGLYDPQENILYLDLTEPFFENAYTLYHELDHVRIFHSGVVEKFGLEVRQLLSLPETAETQELLKNAILRDYATLELLAIDNSARLYRSTGQLVYQFGDNPTSAKAWHDSYFGSTSEMNLYLPIQSRTMLPGIPDVKVDLGRPVTILQYFTLADHIQDEVRAKKRRDAEKDFRRKQQRVSMDFQDFLKSRQLLHLENYRKRYLNEAPQFQPSQLELAHNELNQAIKIPKPQNLTCSEIQRIGAALGSYARYGLPFPYSIDKGWESCVARPGALNFKGGPLSVRAGLPNLRGPTTR